MGLAALSGRHLTQQRQSPHSRTVRMQAGRVSTSADGSTAVRTHRMQMAAWLQRSATLRKD